MRATLALAAALILSASAQDGGQTYATYCGACHGADGNGATGGQFPPLAGSNWIGGDAARSAKIVLHGLHGPVEIDGRTYNLEMPPQGAALTDPQIAAILTFVRSSWGNQGDPVSADQIKTYREETADRTTPWTAEEILKLYPLPLAKTALSDLLSQAYSGDWSELPDFSKLTASNIEEEHDGIISLDDAPFEEHFAMVWTAKFQAPADGNYTFVLDADDSAALMIDGKTVVEVLGAGPMNGSRARQGKIKLTKGAHDFRVEFLEMADQQGIALGWKGPGVKNWRWLSRDAGRTPKLREPIPVEPRDGRPVIYRNFIAGTTPRAIGVGFPGGLNLAWSADHFAPELLWTGDFIDGTFKWVDRGTDNNPPAGENVVRPTNSPALPEGARFRGYKLDPDGNPTFSTQIGSSHLLDSWQAASGALVRTLTLKGGASPVEILISDHPLEDEIQLEVRDGELRASGGKSTLKLAPNQSATLTYRWK